MKQWKVACMALLLAGGGLATAATIRDGGDPDKGRVLWADPFDWYTQWNYDNSSLWVGGPIPAGDTNAQGAAWATGGKEPTPTCANSCLPAFGQRQTFPGTDEMARAQWVRGRFVGDECTIITTPTGFTVNETGSFDARYGGGEEKCGSNSCYGAGQTATTLMMQARANYCWGTGGSYAPISQFTNDLLPRIQAIAANKGLGTMNAVNGTDADPLVVTFELRPGTAGNNHGLYDVSYIELSLEDETAPMDYIWRGDPTKTYPDPDGCPQGPYPVICQQVREVNENVSENGGDLVYLNENCPDLVPPTTRVWASFAFGINALLDRDPCGILEQGVDAHIPTKDHWAVFDGSAWREIRGGRYLGLTEAIPAWPRDEHMQAGAGPCGDFNIGGGINVVYLKIVTDSVLVYVKNTEVEPDHHWGAVIPRVYKGPFNKIRWGGGKGCELWRDPNDPTKYECKPEGTPYQCLTYSSASHEGYRRTEMDTMAMYIGTEADYSMADNLVYVDTINGACCVDGACSVTDQVTCLSQGGRWDGVGSQCGDYLCCPEPYGDSDGDNDVDMVDFAVLQSCLTIGGGTVTSECECLDRAPLGTIDSTEVDYFAQFAATGPGVVAP